MLMMWSLLVSGLGGATFFYQVQIPENNCPFGPPKENPLILTLYVR